MGLHPNSITGPGRTPLAGWLLVVAACVGWCPPARAAAGPEPAFALANGLRVAVHRDPSQPVVSVQVRYRAGAKDDPIGRSGLAHLLEHLLFRGSRHLREGEVFDRFRAAGALEISGTTSWDDTVYRVLLPASQLEIAFWVFSSQMGFFLEQAGLDRALVSERNIVLEERSGRFEDPEALVTLVRARALYPPGHPYARVPAGNPEELARVTVEDVRSFFLRHYRPGNAELAVAGNVQPARVRQLAQKYFGPLPGRAAPPASPLPPLVVGHRRVSLQAPVGGPELQRTWPVPAEVAADQAASLRVLAELVGERLVRRFRGTRVASQYDPRLLAAELLVKLRVDTDQPPAELESGLDEVTTALTGEPVPDSELDAAVRAAQPTAEGWPDEPAAFPGAHRAPAGSGTPTPEALQRLARAVFGTTRVTVTIHPFPAAPRAGQLMQSLALSDPDRPPLPVPPGTPPPDADFRHRPPALAAWTPPSTARALAPLPGALPCWHVPLRAADDRVWIELLFRLPETGTSARQRAAGQVLAQMMVRHTHRRSESAWRSALSDLDGWLDWSHANGLLRFTLRVPRDSRRLRPALALLAELTTQPRFDEPNLEEAKRTLGHDERYSLRAPMAAVRALAVAELRGDPSDTGARAASIEPVTLEDTQEVYRRMVHPKNAAFILTAAGAPSRIRAELARAFRAWRAPPGVEPASWVGPAPPSGTLTVLDRPDLTRAAVAMTFPLPGRWSPDHPAAELAAEALAGSLSSRLGRLRNRAGWLYAFAQQMVEGRDAGALLLIMEVAPARVAQLVETVRRDVADLATTTLPVGELQSLRQGRALARTTELATSARALERLLEAWAAGVPLSEPQQEYARLASVSGDQLRQAAATHLHTTRASVYVVGPRAGMAPGLQALGPAKLLVWSLDRGASAAADPRR